MQNEELIITERTRKTCLLINLLTLHKGYDISGDIETLIKDGADISVKIPNYDNNTSCEDDDYDDFRTIHKISYYPVVFAIRHHCVPNVVRALAKKSIEYENYTLILNQVLDEFRELFSQLYRNPYFSERANNPSTYHYKLKHLVEEYLTIFDFTPSIFDTCPNYKLQKTYKCENPDCNDDHIIRCV